jgi:hypothetical protein
VKSYRVSLTVGLLLSGLSGGLLVYALRPVLYAPALTPKSVNIRADCKAGTQTFARLVAREPAPLQDRIAVDLHISPISNCRDVLVRVRKPIEGIYLEREGAIEVESREELARAIASRRRSIERARVGKEFDNYAVPTDSLEGPWALTIEGAFVGQRVTFDTYAVQGAVSLPPGAWTLEVAPGGRYEIVTGQSTFAANVDPSSPLEVSRKTIDVQIRFVAISSLSEMFAIFLSTLLGVGITLIAEALSIGLSARRIE